MKMLVTFALENEFAPWRKMRRFQRVSVNPWDQAYEAKIGPAEVRVVLTGAGRFAAQRALGRAFDDAPELCIASGLAGSLKPAHAPGAILAARTVVDVSGTRSVASDSKLADDARGQGAKVVEKFLTSERVIATADEKKVLGASGDAVDMESLYVLAAARHHGVRAIAIRVIGDGVESDLPLDFNRTFNERGAVSVRRVLGQIAARPHRIGGVLRLAHETDRAAAALADFLDVYVQRIDLSPLPEAKAEALAI
jgi:nucleoside phosphorylase